MYDTTWTSYYVGEPTVVRIGTKPRPKPKAPAQDASVTPPAAKAGEGTGSAPALPTASRRRLGPSDASTNQSGTRVGRCVARVDRRVRRLAVRDALAVALDAYS